MPSQVFWMVRMEEIKTELHEATTVLEALSGAQAVIYFDPKGYILEANENFCDAMGYREDEIVGKHHRIFVPVEEARSDEYAKFWDRLARGDKHAGSLTRIGKDGEKRYIEASYNALRNEAGEVERVVKFALDVTARRRQQEILLERVSETAASIADESAAIQLKSNELSKRSEKQASTVEQTSAAMEEISHTVNSNVANAEQANEEARQAKSQAEKGSEVVENAIAAMQKIENGSKEIRKFIEVIDSIAFQTNLLALNAGVEAARAGEAGRGFAVVASEVRALAQRASESAKDINALIDGSAREVEQGARLVNETGNVLHEITEGVKKFAEGIENIFTASREQASGVLEINQSISNIDKDIQLNATMSQETAVSATTLAQNAEELTEAIRDSGTSHKRRVSASTQRPMAKSAPRPRPAAPRATLQPEATMPPLAERKIAVNATTVKEDHDDDAWTEF
ncbi:MAG: methyl-accepting chemotaxis protein [Pseudomonadota bacterium]